MRGRAVDENGDAIGFASVEVDGTPRRARGARHLITDNPSLCTDPPTVADVVGALTVVPPMLDTAGNCQ